MKVYVSNRVRKIQEHNLKLLYISGSINPADLVSKPTSTNRYIKNPLWSEGPPFLRETNDVIENQFSLENVTKASLPNHEQTLATEEAKKSITLNLFTASTRKHYGITELIEKYSFCRLQLLLVLIAVPATDS